MSNKEYNAQGMDQLKKELLDEGAPTLAAMNKTNPFVVPENYFSSLEHRVLQQIKPQPLPVQPTFKEQFKMVWEAQLAFFFTGRVIVPVIASVIVLGVSFGGFHHAMVNSANYAMGNTAANSTEAGIELSAISKEELNAYVIGHAEEFDLNDVDQATLSAVAEKYKMKDVAAGSPEVNEMDESSPIEEML